MYVHGWMSPFICNIVVILSAGSLLLPKELTNASLPNTFYNQPYHANNNVQHRATKRTDGVDPLRGVRAQAEKKPLVTRRK